MGIEKFQPGNPILTPPPRPPAETAGSGRFRLDLMIKDLLRNWYLVLGAGLAALLLASFVIAGLGPTYTASMIVTPSTEGALNKVQFYGNSYSFADDDPILGRFGGSKPNNFDHFIVLLNSNRIAEVLEERYGVSRLLFGNLWDQESQSWRKPDGLAFRVKAFVRGLFGYPEWKAPRAKNVRQYLRKHLDVSPVSRGAMRSVSLSGKDPEHLASILMWLFENTSALLRDERNAALRNNIAYLQDRLGQARIDIYRESLISLLADQERQLMLSQTDQPFGVVLLEPPVKPDAPSGPDPLLLLFAAGLAGLCLGGLLVLSVTLPRRRSSLALKAARPVMDGDA